MSTKFYKLSVNIDSDTISIVAYMYLGQRTNAYAGKMDNLHKPFKWIKSHD